jgi:hypothetical protein
MSLFTAILNKITSNQTHHLRNRFAPTNCHFIGNYDSEELPLLNKAIKNGGLEGRIVIISHAFDYRAKQIPGKIALYSEGLEYDTLFFQHLQLTRK